MQIRPAPLHTAVASAIYTPKSPRVARLVPYVARVAHLVTFRLYSYSPGRIIVLPVAN